MDAMEHLPGCDLQHTPRQRCSSWQPTNEVVVTASKAVDNARPATLLGWIFYAGLPVWIIGAIFLALLLIQLVLIALGFAEIES